MVTGPNSLSFEAVNLPSKHVTVYGDRAEVNKSIKAQLKQGPNEIVVTKLSRSLDSDSIRVEGYGKAVISEVKYQEKRVIKDDEVKEKEKEIHERVKKLREEQKKIEQNLERHKKQKEVLDGIANNLGQGGGKQPPCSPENNRPTSAVFSLISDHNGLENLEKFLGYYEKRTNELDSSLNDLNDKLDKINEEINVAESGLSENYQLCGSRIKEVTIHVSAIEAGDVVLDLFYVVYNSSWKPSYDIRVQTSEQTMRVTYYGLIQQNTDEDWSNTKLTLSTATPRIGGQVPELGTTKVGFYKPPMIQARMSQANSFGGSPVPCMYAMAGAAPLDRDGMMLEEATQARSMKVVFAEALVKENVTSTTFEIENPTSIPSDNSSHKVTIAIVDLKPTFEYEAIPSKSTYAYFKAKVVNSSQYPFLAGPTAIFVNESFVANGCIKSVNTNEHFEISLGVDPSIKVEYKAAKKFNEETGLLSKSTILTHEQKIGLNNTKADSVRITCVEPLPQSTEEKLKVVLVEPLLSRTEKGAVHVIMNKHNNVEWQLNLAANEKKELILKYQIEHPKGEQIEYNEE